MQRLKILLLAALGATAALPRAPAAPLHSFVVIIAPGVDRHQLSRESLSLIFRRKQNFWPDGTRVQPVNLPPQDPLRQTFSQCILGEAPEATEDYWREMYFHGVLPPHVVASQEAELLFVLATPGAVGYVASCPTDPRVVVAMTFGDPPNCPRRSSSTCVSLQD